MTAPSEQSDHPSAIAAAHVVTYPWRHAWRGWREVAACRRILRGRSDVVFSVVGRSSGGAGTRRVNRTLSPSRFVTLTESASGSDATALRAELDDRWRSNGALVWSASLVPNRSSGTWGGRQPFSGPASESAPAPRGPVASVTYAQVRPRWMGHFYVLGFPKTARRMTGKHSPMLAGIGFGDVPLRHACTFSLWPDVGDLLRSVQGRTEPHGEIARRSIEEGWLSESLFARFSIADHSGDWAGTDPLATQS